jgi:hypothetical protein
MKKILIVPILAIMLCSGFYTGPAAETKSNLNDVIAYPNPFNKSVGDNEITFENLTSKITIRIYKLTGELIWEKDFTTTDGKVVWEVCNDSGRPIAGGIYIYLITNSQGHKTAGKLAIIR